MLTRRRHASFAGLVSLTTGHLRLWTRKRASLVLLGIIRKENQEAAVSATKLTAKEIPKTINPIQIRKPA